MNVDYFSKMIKVQHSKYLIYLEFTYETGLKNNEESQHSLSLVLKNILLWFINLGEIHKKKKMAIFPKSVKKIFSEDH